MLMKRLFFFLLTTSAVLIDHTIGEERFVLLDGRTIKGEIYWKGCDEHNSWGIQGPLVKASNVTFRNMSKDHFLSVRHFLKAQTIHETVSGIALGGNWLEVGDVEAAVALDGIQRVFVDSALDLNNLSPTHGIKVIRSHSFVIDRLREKADPAIQIVARVENIPDTPQEFCFRLLEVSRGRNKYPVQAPPLTLEDIQGLVLCDTLEHLDLSCSEISDQLMGGLQNLKHLKTLWLDSTHISSQGLEKLSPLKLERLDLSFDDLDDFPIHPTLKEIRVCDGKVSESALRSILSCPHLKILDLRGATLPENTNLKDNGIKIMQ